MRCLARLLPMALGGLLMVPAPDAVAGPLSSHKLSDDDLAKAHAATRKLKGCDGDWVVVTKQSFRLSGRGDARDGSLFIAASCSENNKFGFLTRLASGQVYTWETHDVHNHVMPYEVVGVSFADFNGDGESDVIVAVSAMTGVGPDGAKPYSVFDALMSDADTAKTGRMRRLPSGVSGLEGARNLAQAVRALRKHFNRRE